MGTAVSLAIRGAHADGPLADQAWAGAVRVLEEADAVFSTYRTDSAVSRWRRGELALGECPPEVAEVLDLAEQARIESHGAFDIEYGGPGGLPDPTGVVKGWAVQRAADVLAELPDTDFCLSAGGDMVCRTALPTAQPWRIGIEDPRDTERLVATVPVWNGAVATSGTAQRGAHILDPRTGRPSDRLLQVTVLAPDLVSADVDATAAFVLGEWAEAWLAARRRTAVVVPAAGAAVVVGG
jgi:thiamine biosynthesis lipoprotein